MTFGTFNDVPKYNRPAFFEWQIKVHLMNASIIQKLIVKADDGSFESSGCLANHVKAGAPTHEGVRAGSQNTKQARDVDLRNLTGGEASQFQGALVKSHRKTSGQRHEIGLFGLNHSDFGEIIVKWDAVILGDLAIAGSDFDRDVGFSKMKRPAPQPPRSALREFSMR